MKLRTKLPQQLTPLFTQESWDRLLGCITLFSGAFDEYNQYSSGILHHDGIVLSVNPKILFITYIFPGHSRLYLVERDVRIHLNIFFPPLNPYHEQAFETLTMFRLKKLLTAAYYFPDVVMKHATTHTCVHVA